MFGINRKFFSDFDWLLLGLALTVAFFGVLEYLECGAVSRALAKAGNDDRYRCCDSDRYDFF